MLGQLDHAVLYSKNATCRW